MKNYKVIFADLDGTLINTLSEFTFPRGIWDMRFNFPLLDKLKELKPELIAIVTNQGGIEQGFVNERDFVKGKMAFVTRSVQEYTGCTCVFQYCRTNDKNSIYRKPNKGMLDQVLYKDLGQLGMWADKDEMLMIGDASGKPGQFSDSDRKTAENFGIDYMDVEDFIKA